MFKNLIFQLFKTKGLAKTEKFISARKGVKSAHDFFSEFFPYHMPYFGVYFLEWKVRATKERANRSVAEVCESFNLIIAHFAPPYFLCRF